MKTSIIFSILLFEILTCSNTSAINRNDTTRKQVFNYLCLKNEFIAGSLEYIDNINAFYIRDLHTKKEIVNNVSICLFGVYNEDMNCYIFLKNGSKIVFINPAEMKLEDAIALLPVIFQNKYPYDYHLIVKDINEFYTKNNNSIITINP